MSKTRLRQFFVSLMLLMSAGLGCPCVAAGHGEGRAPFVDVRQFGAKGDGAADDTAAIMAAAGSIDHGTVFFPPGTYICRLKVDRSGVSLVGSGSSSTTLRMPPGKGGNVLELGDASLCGHATPCEWLSVSGITIDGNRGNTPGPGTAQTGWGMLAGGVKHSSFTDVVAVNCWNGGVGFFADSNCNNGSFRVAGCGNPARGTPGFEMSGSKCCVFGVVSEDCAYGARVAEGCIGNRLDVSIVNPKLDGLLCGSASAARGCSNNQIKVTVSGGASGHAVLVGARWHGNIVDVALVGWKGKGVCVIDPGPDMVKGTDGEVYACLKDHTSEEDTAPVTGGAWSAYWRKAGGRGDAWLPDSAYMSDNKAWGNLVSESQAAGLEAGFIGK